VCRRTNGSPVCGRTVYHQRSLADIVAVTQEATPPPPFDASHDAEAATQQLLDEVSASASRVKPSNPLPSSDPPPSSAVLGANLLNAARIEHHLSSPVRMAPKSSNGRLSRVGPFTEPRRQNLARPRQRDVYEFPDESPEKAPFKLPKMVNRSQPMKIIKGNKVQKENAVRSSEPVAPSLEGDAVDDADSEDREKAAIEPPMPSSPPNVAPGANDIDANDIQNENRLPNGNTRCAVVSYRVDKPAGPRYEQCHNAGTNDTDNGPCCTRHVNKPGSLRCEYILLENGDPVQCRGSGAKGTTLCAKHARLASNSESTRKRKSVDALEMQGESARSTKLSKTTSNPEVPIPVRESRKGRPAKPKFESEKGHGDDVTDLIETTESTSPDDLGHVDSKALTIQKKASRSSQGISSKPGQSTRSASAPDKAKKGGESAAKRDQPQPSDGEEREHGDQGQDSSNNEEAASTATYMPRIVKRAFKFLKLEKRPGRCKTELCLSIKSVCDKVRNLLAEGDLSIEEIAENIDDVQGMLNEVRNTDQGDRVSIKADMYGYVFRSLTKVLSSLYHALAKHEDDITKSLDAMRIFSPLVHHILIIKDLMASWKVTLPQRYEGDRIIKDVDIHLIAPLRLVDFEFGKRLRHLESKEKAEQELADIERRIEEENAETERANIRKASQRDRWKRWQDLHIARMACEPVPHKRAPLRIIKLEELEETDANGIKFQRLPVFKDRETPPARNLQAMPTLKSWSEEQETALLEFLERFPGEL
jgi:hypothetical protein